MLNYLQQIDELQEDLSILFSIQKNKDKTIRTLLNEKAQLIEQIEAMRAASQRDWVEDFSHENGQYSCTCAHCEKPFIGHKRRVECKECFIERIAASETTAILVFEEIEYASEPETPSEALKEVFWSVAEFEAHVRELSFISLGCYITGHSFFNCSTAQFYLPQPTDSVVWEQTKEELIGFAKETKDKKKEEH